MRVERYAHDGAAEGLHDGKKVRVHGMIVGEEGVVEARAKQGLLVGTLKEIIVASPSRRLPDELHYLTCSPWQVMEYPEQIKAKRELLASLFSYHPDAPNPGFTPARRFYGYRTKIEYSFADRKDDRPIPLSLAFHERGGGARRIALPEGCMLASEGMNRVALAILEKLRAQGYIARDLKSLVVRESKSEGKLLAALFVKRMTIEEIDVSDIEGLSGFIAFHSTEKSPASVPTKHLYSWGDDHLTEVMDGVSIRYSWDSFFQNNIDVFLDAVGAMREHVKKGDKVLELYSGAGTIGLLLSGLVASVNAMEIVPAAVEAAKLNARVNGIENYEAACLPAEAIEDDLIGEGDVLLLDPPRAGLHPKLLEAILAKMPKKVIYLSCNPTTQARDYSALLKAYRIERLEGYDFYPQTPHLESLLILSLREK